MGSNSDYQWFIKILDAKTNESIAMLLQETGKIADDDTLEIIDNKGKRHLVWRVEYRIIDMAIRSKNSRVLRFRVFKRKGEAGQVEEWKFGTKKKPRLQNKKTR